MNSLYEALFNYAQENRVPRLTHQPECRQAGKNGEFHQGWLEERLSPGQREHLAAMLDEWALCDTLTEEAVFLAGLSIGLELAALCGLPE